MPEAVANARAHATAVALTWELDKEQVEVVELLVSELVTNGLAAGLPHRVPCRAGLLAGQTPEIELQLTILADRLLVEVWDQNPSLPPSKPGPLGDLAERGRGLFLVDQLSMRWGSYFPALVSEVEPPVLGSGRFQPAPGSIEVGQRLLTGKVVWCEIATVTATAATGAHA